MPRYGRLGDVIRRPRLTGLQRERVRHHDRVELHSVLETFRQQRAAVLQLRRSDDETVPPAQAESTLEIATMLAAFDIERLWAATHMQVNILMDTDRRQIGREFARYGDVGLRMDPNSAPPCTR